VGTEIARCGRVPALLTMPFGYSHDIILQIAQWGIRSFFQDIHVVNAENVPKTGPVIVCVARMVELCESGELNMIHAIGRVPITT
jgi:hypothetical protein